MNQCLCIANKHLNQTPIFNNGKEIIMDLKKQSNKKVMGYIVEMITPCMVKTDKPLNRMLFHTPNKAR